MKPAVHVRTVWDKSDPRPETFTSCNKIDNMSCSCRQTPCIDYHVKQHSWGTDVRTSQEKNADMRSVQEGVWFSTKSKRKLWVEQRMNKDTQEIGQLLKSSTGEGWTEEKTWTRVCKDVTGLDQSTLLTTWQTMTDNDSLTEWFRPSALLLNQVKT